MKKVASKNLKSNLVRCEHPRLIRNKYTGQMVEVPCGKCNLCVLNKCNVGTLNCSIEEASHRFCYFVTLTYANEYIPYVVPLVSVPRYDANACEQLDVFSPVEPCPEQHFNFVCGSRRILDKYGTVLHSGLYDYKRISQIVEKCNVPGNGIGYLDYEDVKLYIKRLRKRLSMVSDARLRYYCVGEYGPKSFRPHWHLLFYFDCPKVAEVFIKTASDCWQYGRTDVSASRKSVASYLSGYVNSFTCIPSLFKTRFFRPKCYHSFHFGFSPYEEDKASLYEDPVTYLNTKVVSVHGGYLPAKLTNNLRAWLFPRCLCYADTSIDEKLYLYTYSDYFRQITGKDDCLGRALLCWYNYKSNKNLLLAGSVRYLFRRYCSRPGLIDDREFFLKWMARVFYISDHFLNFVCDGNRSLVNLRVTQIINYYNYLRSNVLSNWYHAQSEYVDLHPDDTDFAPFFAECECNDDGVFSDIVVDVDNPEISSIFDEAAKRVKDRIKHRELNDMNRIFFD